MDFLNSWLQGIIISVIVATIIELILPNGNSKKYIKVVLGVYVVFNIITPIVNQFFDSNFELSSIIDVDEYVKKMETYEVKSQNINIEQTNEESIKQIYISNLKKDMEAKLQDKGYIVTNLEIEIENTESYEIKGLYIKLKKKEQLKEENNISQNKVNINEIEKVEINIGKNTEQKIDEKESNITEKEKSEIEEYLKAVYQIKKIRIN